MSEPAKNYNADAEQRYEFTVKENGEVFPTAHKFKSLTDERYMEYIKAVEIQASEEKLDSKFKEATEALWNDLILEVENIDVADGEEWKSLIESEEKIEAINNLLAVAVVEAEKTATGKRTLKAAETQTITTEAFFDGVPVQQSHTLKARSEEFKKKYDRIQRKRYKEETTKGLRRKAKLIHIPQNEAIAVLYDEMIVAPPTGFETWQPMRFKTTVIHYLFEPKISEKK